MIGVGSNSFLTPVTLAGATPNNALQPVVTIAQTQPTGGGSSSIPIGLYVTATSNVSISHLIGILSYVAPTASSQTGQIWYGIEGRVDQTVSGISYGVLGLASLNAAANTGSIVVGVQGRAEYISGDVNGLTIGGWFWGFGGAVNYAAIFGGSRIVGDHGQINIRGEKTDNSNYYETQISISGGGVFLVDLNGGGLVTTSAQIKLSDTAGTSKLTITDSSNVVLFEVDSNVVAMPRAAMIMGVSTPKTTSGAWTPAQNNAAYFASYNLSAGAQNNSITFDFMGSGGTYTIDIFCLTAANAGIYSISIDGAATAATLDSYTAGTAAAKLTATSITVTGNGTHTIKLTMATKNGSSSSYFGFLSGISLVRTA